MTEKGNQAAAASAPLGRMYTMKELPGLIGRKLVVPPGRVGVALAADGSLRTFPPGEQRLLSAWQRLLGRGIGLTAGFVPSGEFLGGARLERLLSGDRELLDARLVCTLEVRDAGQFFREVVAPRHSLPASALELDPRLLEEELGRLTVQYAASDLEQGRLSAQLAGRLAAPLELALAGQGLRLVMLHPLSFSRAENRLLIARKAGELAERLKDVEIEAKMAEIESQAELDGFLEQMAPGLQQAAHLNAGAPPSAPEKAPEKRASTADMLRGWLGLEAAPGGSKRPWRLGDLFQKKQAARLEHRRPPANFPLARLTWLVCVLGLAISSSWIVEWIAPDSNLPDRLSFHLAIWGITIPILIESLNAIQSKREELFQHYWELPGYQQLDNLVGNDRQWADELVREQCARELAHVRELAEEMRSMEYQRGNTSLALKLKNEVEQNAAACAEKIQRPDYGRPPYVTDLHINRDAWLHMLDSEEDLLLLAHALNEQAKLLLQKAHSAELSADMLTRLNADISHFCNRFFERGRPLQVPPAAILS